MKEVFVFDSKAEAGFKVMIINSGSKLFGERTSSSNLTNALNYYISRAIKNGELPYTISNDKLIIG